tara:strand:+ start:17818 stop:18027 length:210 start_codon:yes stop_codon:yes gene_type:complete
MKAWLIGIIGIIGSIAAIFFYGKRSGKQEQQLENNKQVLDNVKKAKEVSNDNDQLTTSEQLDELRDDIR